MTDYEKLKAFAEELIPECFSDQKYWRHNGEEVIDTGYSKNDRDINIIFGIFNKKDKIRTKGDTCEVYNCSGQNPKDLDQWINETREYWRAKGLPSLQKPKGKLYEMPNTIVHFENEEEYNEYMQMCEDVGWTWAGGDKPVGTHEFRNDIEVEDRFVSGRSILYGNKKRISLQELKQKIEIGNNEDKVDDVTFIKELIEVKTGRRVSHIFIDEISKGMGTVELLKEVKQKTTLMETIKNTAKRLLLSEPEKTFVKAGLMDIDKKWKNSAREMAQEQMLDEYMDTKKFKDQMLEVANVIIEDSN